MVLLVGSVVAVFRILIKFGFYGTAEALGVLARALPYTTRRSLAAGIFPIGRRFERQGNLPATILVYSIAAKIIREGFVEDRYILMLRIAVNDCLKNKRFDDAASFASDLKVRIFEYKISSIKQHCERAGLPYSEIRPERTIADSVPSFFGETYTPENIPGHKIAPAQYFAEVHDCKAFSGGNPILAGDALLYDLFSNDEALKLFSPYDFVLNKRTPMPALLPEQRAMVFPVSEESETVIDSGLQMFGSMTFQYGHWLLEYLPRMLVYESKACTWDAPLIIDSGMPATHLEALQLLNSRKRDVVVLPTDRATRIAKLGVSPTPAIFPQSYNLSQKVYDAIWPSDVLRSLKATVLERIGSVAKPHRRIFVSRASFGARHLTNEAEVITELKPYNFEIVRPEALSFVEQVRTFAESRIVVGTSSSGLHNTLFCGEETKVLALNNSDPEFNFRCHASVNSSGGAAVTFLRGASVPSEMERTHNPFTIDVQKLRAAVASMI